MSPVYDAGAGMGFGQHQRYLGAYKPVTISAGHGIDREPEATLPGGRCQEFLSIERIPTTGAIIFRTRFFPHDDANRNGIGDTCE